ncbi:type II toxin-antitoxin system VapC family toxin [Bosea caraganae]|uniref:Type II toxin-antitoxin system VapC family toxin n=1 Tax=Bosea caraganae TaxID=2763117 RepID=A0A370L692_9HYPH|nr:PIN domain-containing protein [Bosea caraganae]RDJ23218.1 type II toxin-antitoxin system VapC family toxin [Bosea caraganae]RDJ24668.1 type II toxin-antitoxin system VapC family toxin [Bosea caraganae]
MILVDTSIWIDHLRAKDSMLAGLLKTGHVLMHPFVLGELALGHLRQREMILRDFSHLPHAIMATHVEVLHFIERHALFGLGVGLVDVHLLASVRLTDGASIWTRDKRLNGVASQLGLAATLQ